MVSLPFFRLDGRGSISIGGAAGAGSSSIGLSVCRFLDGFGAALVGTAGVAFGCFLLDGFGAALVGLANCSASSKVRADEEAGRLLCGSSLGWMGVRDGAALVPTVSCDGGGGG